jgi:Ca-activated chloride channel family protein
MPDDRDLQSMLPDVPPPPEAKARALDAALAAFDANFSTTPQGSPDEVRPMRTAGNGPASRHGGTIMNRTRLAIAASLLLAVGAGLPVAWQLSRSGPEPGGSDGRGSGTIAEAPPPSTSPAPPAPPTAPASVPQAQELALLRERGAGDGTTVRSFQAHPTAPSADAVKPTPMASVSPRVASRLEPSRLAESEGARRKEQRAAPSSAPAEPQVRALPDRPAVAAEPHGRDQFAGQAENPYKVTREEPVSTFSVDVDTASYSFVRASLARNALPPKDAVRTEELVNYFPYAYPAPASADEPFRTTVSVFPSPWNEGRRIVHIGIKGYAVSPAERPKANLVFLVDTSGSMNAPNRLPLAKQALAMLVGELDARDKVAIVTYAGSAGTALEPTPASEKAKILAAIERLGAGGSTAGAEGIRQAYALAEANFDPAGVNRVLLATDGDFNVGITSREELKGFVERKREKGIFLSVLGFGIGNYNDAMMQALAQNGNGTAAYIDTLGEARKVLVEEATSTIVPIAKDVKIQVEFNPAHVAEYRLVGYETRALRREDFNNDKVDAGDVGSGHTVTAIYEIVPVGAPRVNSDLRYGPSQAAPAAPGQELGFLSLRYKLPKSDTSRLATTPIGASAGHERFEDASQEARFAISVAGFAELLRGGRHTGRLTYDDVIRTASAAKGEDPFGYRGEFVQMVRAAKTAAAMQQLPR